VFGMYLRGTTSAGVTSTLWSDARTFGGPAELVIAAKQNGSNIDITVRFAETYVSTASVAGALGHIAPIALNPNLNVFAA
jgi:hypothetical protein